MGGTGWCPLAGSICDTCGICGTADEEVTPQLQSVLVQLEEVSELFRNTLMAVEDRDFYNHFGLAPLSIVRAMLANIRASLKAFDVIQPAVTGRLREQIFTAMVPLALEELLAHNLSMQKLHRLQRARKAPAMPTWTSTSPAKNWLMCKKSCT